MQEHLPQAYAKHVAPFFRWLHCSSDFRGDKEHAMSVLRFSFMLPERQEMHKLARCMDLVMRFIDVVAAFEMPPKAAEKAELARAAAVVKEKAAHKTTEENAARLKRGRQVRMGAGMAAACAPAVRVIW
jgi:Protein of unknown function (DUF1682)